MRLSVVCIFLFCVACSHSIYSLNDSGVPIRQCSLPALYAISSNVPESHREIVENGFQYWNIAIGTRLFFSMDVVEYIPSDPETGGFIIVGMNDGTHKSTACAITTYRYTQKNPCMSTAVKVYINESCLNVGKDVFETAMRHESGHVLGLGHSRNLGDLMWPYLDKSFQNPIDASVVEIKAIKDLYEVNNETEIY